MIRSMRLVMKYITIEVKRSAPFARDADLASGLGRRRRPGPPMTIEHMMTCRCNTLHGAAIAAHQPQRH